MKAFSKLIGVFKSCCFLLRTLLSADTIQHKFNLHAYTQLVTIELYCYRIVLKFLIFCVDNNYNIILY